ncbi:MAG: hypothetical protein U0694_13105 [Anaerolineae bacterium]
MQNQATLTLPPLPQDSMRALANAAAQHSQWRVLRGGKDEQPRFVIEKRVRYEIMRGGQCRGSIRSWAASTKAKAAKRS